MRAQLNDVLVRNTTRSKLSWLEASNSEIFKQQGGTDTTISGHLDTSDYEAVAEYYKFKNEE